MGPLVVALWLPVVLFWRHAPFTLTFDDAYYYFEIARNLADGEGSTFDRISDTNGYHPLWMAFSVIPYALGLDDTAAVRALLVVQLLGWGTVLVIVARVADRAVAGWPRLARADHRRAAGTVVAAVALLGFNPFVLKMVVNGLESGLAVLLYAILLGRQVRRGAFLDGSARDRWRLGAILAACFLARTDAVLLFAPLGLAAIREATRGRPWAVRPLVEVFAIPGAVVTTFLAVNQVLFDSPLQVSGSIKRVTPGPLGWLALVALAAAAVVLVWATPSMRRSDRFPRTTAFVAVTGWFAGFCVLVVAYYMTLQAVPFLWYFAPLVLYATFLVAVGVADFVESAVVEGSSVGALQAILLGPLAAGLVLQAAVFVDPEVRSIQVANRDAGLWISENLPEDAVLGSWDAGVIGYFTEQRIINLDGVVNSVEFRDEAGAGRGGTFLAARAMAYVVNHGETVDDDDPDVRALVDTLYGSGTGAALGLVAEFPFTYAGTTDRNWRPGATRDMAVRVYALPR